MAWFFFIFGGLRHRRQRDWFGRYKVIHTLLLNKLVSLNLWKKCNVILDSHTDAVQHSSIVCICDAQQPENKAFWPESNLTYITEMYLSITPELQ